MPHSQLYSKLSALHPTRLEAHLRKKGYDPIAGTDEAGRGALAGPVVAGAVILPYPNPIRGIKDSKMLKPALRERLYKEITEIAVAWAVGIIEVPVIDQINIFHASLRAMAVAIQRLKIAPRFLLVDGAFKVPPFATPHRNISVSFREVTEEEPLQMAVVRGDQHCKSIAAASILAKVTRDRLMTQLENQYPDYRFSVHKGYPTPHHRAELRKSGVCAIHRKSFTLGSAQE